MDILVFDDCTSDCRLINDLLQGFEEMHEHNVLGFIQKPHYHGPCVQCV